VKDVTDRAVEQENRVSSIARTGLVAGIVLLLCAVAAAAEVRFDFESGKGQGWQRVVGGIWPSVRPVAKCGKAAQIPETGKHLLATAKWHGKDS
jgi:hypothetical protein